MNKYKIGFKNKKTITIKADGHYVNSSEYDPFRNLHTKLDTPFLVLYKDIEEEKTTWRGTKKKCEKRIIVFKAINFEYIELLE